MTRHGIIWRDYTPNPAERRVDYYRKAENARLADRFMQPPQPGTLPRPVADGCANFAREYERTEMLDGRFPDFGD